MSGRHDMVPSKRLRPLLILLGIFGADGLVASLTFHNPLGAIVTGTCLIGIAIAAALLILRRKI